jgi:hypothetical protein
MSGFTIGTIDGQIVSTLSVNQGTAATNTIVAAVAGQKIRVYKLALSAAGAQTVQFVDGASTNLTGAMSLASGTPLVLPMDGNPWLVTAIGNALGLALSSAVNVSGTVWFTQNTSITLP